VVEGYSPKQQNPRTEEEQREKEGRIWRAARSGLGGEPAIETDRSMPDQTPQISGGRHAIACNRHIGRLVEFTMSITRTLQGYK
jgi:hypothetical protein